MVYIFFDPKLRHLLLSMNDFQTLWSLEHILVTFSPVLRINGLVVEESESTFYYFLYDECGIRRPSRHRNMAVNRPCFVSFSMILAALELFNGTKIVASEAKESRFMAMFWSALGHMIDTTYECRCSISFSLPEKIPYCENAGKNHSWSFLSRVFC